MVQRQRSEVSTNSQLPQIKVCLLRKWKDYDGYGLDIATKQFYDHYVEKINNDGPAYCTGLLKEDVIIEVNDINVQNKSHTQIVKLVKQFQNYVKLMVVTKDVYLWMKESNIPFDANYFSVIYLQTPEKRVKTKLIINDGFDKVSQAKRENTYFHRFSLPFPPELKGKNTEENTNQSNSYSKNSNRKNKDSVNRALVDEIYIDKRDNTVYLTKQASKAEMVTLLDPDYSPRLSVLRKWPQRSDYGFRINTVKLPLNGHFITYIDENGPAKYSGLQEGDRIIEINGINVEEESHNGLISLIKEHKNEAQLLVVSNAVYEWFEKRNIAINGELENIIHFETPVLEKINLKKNYQRKKICTTFIESVDKDSSSVVQSKSHNYINKQSIDCKRNIDSNQDQVFENKKENQSFQNQKSHDKVNDIRSNKFNNQRSQEMISKRLNKVIDMPVDAPSPRLCHIKRRNSQEMFGFLLRTYNNDGSKLLLDMNEGSYASQAGLKECDRVIEVNGINVNIDNHSQIKSRIESSGNEVNILVLTEEEYNWYLNRNIIPKNNQSNVINIFNVIDKNDEEEIELEMEGKVHTFGENIVNNGDNTVDLSENQKKNMYFELKNKEDPSMMEEIIYATLRTKYGQQNNVNNIVNNGENGSFLESLRQYTAQEMKEHIFNTKAKNKGHKDLDYTQKMTYFEQL